MGKRRTCPACARGFVVGVRVLFAARTGARRATVCVRCAESGLVVVQDRTGDLGRCVYCETNAAVCCLACVAARSRGEAS